MDKRNFLKLLGVGAVGAVIDPSSLAGPLPEPEPVILLPGDQLKAIPPKFVPMIFVDGRPLRVRRWNMRKETSLDPMVARVGPRDEPFSYSPRIKPSHWELEAEAHGSEDVLRMCGGERHQIGVRFTDNGYHVALIGEGWLADREIACGMETSYHSMSLEPPADYSKDDLMVRLVWHIPRVEMIVETDLFRRVGYDPNQVFVALKPA